MRFIHTADWHLGNQLHDIDRREEARTFFHWLKNQIIEKNVNTLIVAGDIFDTANPPVEARRLYYTFLASLVDTCCKNVIITGGNHDSALLLDSAKDLLEVLHIRVIGSINGLSPEDMCIELLDEDGSANGICMALPFVRELELRNLLSEKISDGDLYALAYKKLYDTVYEAAEKMRKGRPLPIIATGHLYAADLEGRLSGAAGSVKSDDGVKVLDVLGTLGNVPPSVFPPADYIALGHIHYTTMVAKNPAVRYSGSPFVMGFDEADIPHYVLFGQVEASSRGKETSAEKALSVEKLETPQPFVYRRISGSLEDIKNQLMRFPQADKPVFLEVCYKREVGINAQNYLEDAVHALPANASVVSWKIMDTEKMLSDGGAFQYDAVEIKNLDDREIFTRLILTKSGLDADSEEGKAAVEKFLPLFMKLAGEV